jgi:hypothetical protein
MVCEDKSLDSGSAEVQSIEERLIAVPTSALPGSGASARRVRTLARESVHVQRARDNPTFTFIVKQWLSRAYRQTDSAARAKLSLKPKSCLETPK